MRLIVSLRCENQFLGSNIIIWCFLGYRRSGRQFDEDEVYGGHGNNSGVVSPTTQQGRLAFQAKISLLMGRTAPSFIVHATIFHDDGCFAQCGLCSHHHLCL